MLFNSYDFIFFLPLVFLCYWISGKYFKGAQTQNAILVVASYVFYGWVDSRLCILIASISLLCYFSGFLLSYKRKKLILWSTIIIELSFLCYYKYFNFFIQSFIDAFHLFGHSIPIHTLSIILPAGISFYTLTALSYSIDVYKRKTDPRTDFLSFFAFISFFPHLLAGPIGRSTSLLPQFQKERIFNYQNAADGMRQILWGFFKKIVIADSFAIFVDNVWETLSTASPSSLLLAAILFTIQIYCDFSGYSDIAIGTARLFNINIQQNFNYPYLSRNIAEFWRKWHISLTSWFRDYIYIPLGGSRTSTAKIIRNTVIVFLISGLWHGANWTFIVWGLFHALLFIPLLILNKNRLYKDIVAENKKLPSLKESARILFTFALVSVGWIFFRADTVHQALLFIRGITHWEAFLALPRFFIQPDIRLISCMASLAIVVEWFNRQNSSPLEFLKGFHWAFRYSTYIVLAFCIFWFYNDVNTFIYAQF